MFPPVSQFVESSHFIVILEHKHKKVVRTVLCLDRGHESGISLRMRFVVTPMAYTRERHLVEKISFIGACSSKLHLLHNTHVRQSVRVTWGAQVPIWAG